MSVRVVSAVRLVQQRSIVVLIALLVALAGLIEIIRPGAVNASWVSNILEFAAPLGILAAGQTLVVITGGIDLSVANVATAAAYIMASQAPYGVTRAIVAGLLVGVAVGLINGVGVAVFRVQPLIMTLAMGLVVTGSLNVFSQAAVRSVPGVPAV
ncbi:MAG TPA: ABC transporter permease, partial [Chloroflexota bacterium]|nr:ABC transporter permease [Chloroflexota bacterium]